MKAKLDAQAAISGRSQSQEAELRLEHSFEQQGLLPDILRIAYGGSKQIADLMMTVGAIFLVAGEAVAGTREVRERLKSRDWTSDPEVCDVAIEAAHAVLEAFRPAGAIPDEAGLGVRVATLMLKDKENMREMYHSVSKADLSAQLQAIAKRLSVKSAPLAADMLNHVEMRRRRAAG
jgi:hypothetical protein